jgi:hypothetical protein
MLLHLGFLLGLVLGVSGEPLSEFNATLPYWKMSGESADSRPKWVDGSGIWILGG